MSQETPPSHQMFRRDDSKSFWRRRYQWERKPKEKRETPPLSINLVPHLSATENYSGFSPSLGPQPAGSNVESQPK